MCGFAGEYRFGQDRADLQAVRGMAQRLTHRGPDESGEYVCPTGRCAIGFRRLAVIDPDSSHQPLSLADDSCTIAYNGELYNYQQLRPVLEQRHLTLRTHGDTEVLLGMYQAEGIDFLKHLRGMFAFAIHDRSDGSLLLCRDRLGQKPLWYASIPGGIVFASEAKALLDHPQVPGHLNRTALTYYSVLGYIPSFLTAWEGIHKLPPGHYLRVLSDVPPPVRYWAPPVEPLDVPSDPVDAVREGLREAVRMRMISDVPLGVLLSGGVDSAVIAALMAERTGQAGGVRSFTAGFQDNRLYDERPAAQALADHLGLKHTAITVQCDPESLLDDIVGMADEPFADSSLLPTHLICRAAREHVTVALGGDGGDEVFGGYDRYRAMWLADTMTPVQYLATRVGAALLRPVAPHSERSRLRRFLRFAEILAYPPAVQYLRLRALFQPEDLPRLFTEDFLGRLDAQAPQRWFGDLYETGDFEDEVAFAQRHDLETYLPDDLLVKADTGSMACSLELRAPMLDHPLVELGLSLPREWKLDRRGGKRILEAAFGDMLPPEVFRRPKRGFGVPLADWLRGPLANQMEQTLLRSGFLDRGIIRPEAVVGLMNDHLNGRDDHQHRLWALMVLAKWLETQR
ncbi:MAG: asparagine synthase (glutamine-hydrolyzing) [Phycisphaerae bacterium]